MKAWLTLTMMVLLSGTMARAAIVILDAQRVLEASYSYVGSPHDAGDADGLTSLDLGLLNESVEVTSPSELPQVHALGSQTSNIAGGAISGSGRAVVEANAGPGNAAGVMARSTFSLTFSLSSAMDYVLHFELSATLDTSADALALGEAVFSLDGPGGSVEQESLSNFSGAISGPMVMEENGSLAPGQYTLLVEANQSLDVAASEFLGSGESSFDFSLLLVPEPASAVMVGLLVVMPGLRRRANR